MLLDLDYYTLAPDSVPIDSIADWLEVAHGHVEEVFEACIGDKLRTMFGEVAE